MRNLITEVVINNYIREVELAKSKRPKFFHQFDLESEKIPLKYCDAKVWKNEKKRILGKNYGFLKLGKDKAHFLYDLTNMQKVVSNPTVAGKPRVKIINGQDLHRLTLETYIAAKIKRAIKDQFIKEVEKLEPITMFPIIVEGEIRDTYDDIVNERSYSWDVDNRYLFYGKVFIDVLSGTPDVSDDGKRIKTSKEVIPDDHRGYVTGGGYIFTPIQEDETRQLIFRIYHDARPEVQNLILNNTRVKAVKIKEESTQLMLDLEIKTIKSKPQFILL